MKILIHQRFCLIIICVLLLISYYKIDDNKYITSTVGKFSKHFNFTLSVDDEVVDYRIDDGSDCDSSGIVL